MFGLAKPVGFDQKILLHQLDYTAKQSKNQSKKVMYELLDGYLRKDIAGSKSRKNATTILMKIWYPTSGLPDFLRDELLARFSDFSQEDRLFIHWNLTMLAYPFFKDAVNEFGRLFQLQDEVASRTIIERMKNTYGEKRRVEVATSAVIASLRAWQVINSVSRGRYATNNQITIENPLLQSLLVHTLLSISDADSLYANTLYDHPLLFPFEVQLAVHELMNRSENLTFHYEGVDRLVIVRE